MTYESWRITFQSSEQAARAAFDRCAELATEVRRLQSEVERLPARRAQPTVKTAPLREPNYAFFGLVIETDAEWAERAGRQITEVAE